MRRLFVIAALLSAGCPSGDAPPVLCRTTDAAVCLFVDDAGVSHGCAPGGRGPGDRDDGGGLPPAGAPDQGADLRNLSFGEPCLFNAQCSSGVCFYFRVKGQICTQPCSCPSDCPATSLGCSGMGVCRAGN